MFRFDDGELIWLRISLVLFVLFVIVLVNWLRWRKGRSDDMGILAFMLFLFVGAAVWAALGMANSYYWTVHDTSHLQQHCAGPKAT